MSLPPGAAPVKRWTKRYLQIKEVGAYFNKKFIAYKLDAEKGEGIALSMKYRVTSYPSLIFVDSDGKLVIRSGYKNANQLLEFGQKAERSEQEMTAITSTYNSGNRTPEFIVKYLAFLKERDFPTEEIMIQYLAGMEEKQWLSTENIKLIKAYIQVLIHRY